MRTPLQFVSIVAVVLWLVGGVGAAPTNVPISPALTPPRPGVQTVRIPGPFGVQVVMPGVYNERPPAGLEQTPMAGVGDFSPAGRGALYFYLARPIDEQCYRAALSAKAEQRDVFFLYRDESVIARNTLNRQPSSLRSLEGCMYL